MFPPDSRSKDNDGTCLELSIPLHAHHSLDLGSWTLFFQIICLALKSPSKAPRLHDISTVITKTNVDWSLRHPRKSGQVYLASSTYVFGQRGSGAWSQADSERMSLGGQGDTRI